LPVKQWAEEEGTVTNLEGRVLLRRQTTLPPAGLLSDTDVMAELAARLGSPAQFSYPSSEAIFDELRRASAGGTADYSGISYRRLEEEKGVFWPCPSEDHPGTPRLFAQRFQFPDGRARFHVVHHRPAGEEPDAEYPLYFTTGRYKEHYNSGAQTRRVEKLVDAQPEPRLHMHPRLAGQLEIREGQEVRVESRRGAVTFRVNVNAEIRPDTLFAPFHWGGSKAANILTNPALDPTSRMPEFKVCAVRVVVEDQQ
jgi:assimilatory nitrate reductase catalytic subunit